MPGNRFQRCTILWVVLFCFGCSTPMTNFMHTYHRGHYAIEANELKRAQFYISTEILAQNESNPQSPENVILLSAHTPGTVVDVGPNWLQVSFEEGGRGAKFMTVGSRTDDAYWLATEVEGQTGLYRLKDLDEKVLLVEGNRFRVLYGDNALLQINRDDLEEIISSRRHIKGRTPDTN